MMGIGKIELNFGSDLKSTFICKKKEITYMLTYERILADVNGLRSLIQKKWEKRIRQRSVGSLKQNSILATTS